LSSEELASYLSVGRIASILGIILVCSCTIYIASLAVSEDGRRSLIRRFYLIRKLLRVEVGLRGVLQLGLYNGLLAVAVAFTQGYRQSTFDWQAFFTVLLVVTVVGLLANLLNQSMQFKRILSPGAGRVWRVERKALTAGIIQRINRHIAHSTPESAEVKKILRNLLDVIVLHVRDHQGHFRNDRPHVFANLLIEDGSDLLVVARDSFSHSAGYKRVIPVRYAKETLLCGRAIASRKVLSVGEMTDSYPEGPKTKPYRSILAIPLFRAEGDSAYGALSIDCSQPYFFDSFYPGKVENDLENSLQPYAHLITLVLDTLVSTDRIRLVSVLSEVSNPPRSLGGQP
jgi:hypothetical protein